MKNLLIICLTMSTILILKAQSKITGTKDDFPRGVPYYDKINFEITYKVVEDRGTIRVKVSNPKIFVHPDANYNYQGKFYSRQDLGLANWPQTQKPISFGIYLSVQYPGGTVNHMFSCTDAGVCQDNNDYILASNDNTNNYKPSAFQVSYNGQMSYAGQGNDEVERRIAAKNINPNNSNATAQNTGSDNPLGMGSTQTTSQIPNLESQYAKLGIPASTPNYTKSEITTQIVTQAAGLVGGLLDDWNAASERKAKIREAESSAAIDRKLQKESDKFEFVYLPLMKLAEKGDENARMILYFTSQIFRREFLVPQRERWFQEALNNNNMDALLRNAFTSLLGEKVDGNVIIPEIEKIANMGSADAMIMLADWYDWRSDGGYKKGGDDPKKALEWYLKAAEKGSPNAMYRLGMIYKYGRTPRTSNGYGFLKKWHAEYDVVLDEKVAFDWFTKSLQPDYAGSIYSKADSYEYFSSQFNQQTYYELANIYRKGKVVPKDKEKANEYEFKAWKYENTQKFKYIK